MTSIHEDWVRIFPKPLQNFHSLKKKKKHASYSPSPCSSYEISEGDWNDSSKCHLQRQQLVLRAVHKPSFYINTVQVCRIHRRWTLKETHLSARSLILYDRFSPIQPIHCIFFFFIFLRSYSLFSGWQWGCNTWLGTGALSSLWDSEVIS